MKSTTRSVTRRGFLARAAAAGAIGCVSGIPVGASPRDLEQGSTGGDDALVAPQYRGFLEKSIKELPTPALLIDLDILDHNLQQLASYMKGRAVTFRPHAKAHKSPAVGKLQLASGAKGLCAAKLGEADVLIRGGIKDVLITAEVVGQVKIVRLMSLLALTPDVKAVVDNEQNAIDLSEAALAARRRLKVAIDVNVGQNRTGLDKPDEIVALAQVIAKQKGLELVGLQGYGGNNQHIVGFENRRAREVQSNERVVAARRALEKAGFTIQMVSVGGTGSYNIDADYPGVTEIQPGSYVFMDSHYNKIGGKDTADFSEFGNSLSVLSTVISRAVAGRAILDAGGKALSTDESVPEPMDLTGVTFGVAGDEYGSLRLQNPSRELKVGDQVQITPGHCDTTVNLHNVFFAVRKGMVEHVWPIEGRGRTD
ncbi:MAG: DSD1 family PLP-dependent enzyme [Acidobacteriota bacterium]